MNEQALDNLLRRVMLDAARQECGHFIEELPEHSFSLKFERRMHHLLRRADHPVRYRIIQTVACLLLAALLSGCTALALSSEAREVFMNWVREFQSSSEYRPYYSYRYSGETKLLPDGVAYRPTWVPEGYVLFDEDPFPGQAKILFETKEGDFIDFICLAGTEAGSAGVIIDEGDVQKSVQINGLPADLYVNRKPDALSGLVWASEEGNSLFVIIGCLPEEEMIRMAESVCLTSSRQSPHRPSWHPEEFNLDGSHSGSEGLDAYFKTVDGQAVHSDFTRLSHVEEKLPEIQAAVAGLTPQSIQVRGDDAELYEGSDGINHIVWPVEDGLYWLYGPVGQAALLRMAESSGVEPAG